MKVHVPLFLFAVFALPPTVAAGDFERGKALHDENCLACHNNIMDGRPRAIYIRPDRRIHSREALVRQVQRCRNNLGVPWPEDRVDDVVTYLNRSFYHFGRESRDD